MTFEEYAEKKLWALTKCAQDLVRKGWEAALAQGAKPVDDKVFAEEFRRWWRDHGQLVRSGGGDYERAFAFEAWRHLYPRAMVQPQSANGALAGEGAKQGARAQSAGGACPYACGWEELYSLAIKKAAFVARSGHGDSEDDREVLRQAGIELGQYAIELCRWAMNQE